MEQYPVYMASQTRVMPRKGGNIWKNFYMRRAHEILSLIFDKIHEYDMILEC